MPLINIQKLVSLFSFSSLATWWCVHIRLLKVHLFKKDITLTTAMDSLTSITTYMIIKRTFIYETPSQRLSRYSISPWYIIIWVERLLIHEKALLDW